MPRVLCWLVALCAASALALSQSPAPPVAQPTAPPAYRQANKVAVLTVHGEIDKVTYMSLERRIRRAVKDGADAIVLDINTPGGEMFSTLEICALLKDRNETPVNAVAWIHPHAYSAGTIIALACREIVVSPGATFGDAAPIQVTPWGGLQSLPAAERAKIEAPLLSEILDSARRNHYDEKLVESFIRLTDGVWMLENVNTGEHIFVGAAEYRDLFGQEPPQMIGGVRAPPAKNDRPAIRPNVDQSMPRASDIAGLDPEQQQRQLDWASALPPARQPLSAADRDNWRLVRQVVDSTMLLNLRADEAVYYGLAAAVIANDRELQAFFGAQQVTRYDQMWSESLVRFLTSFWVRGLLIAVFLIALFIELAAPGFGVFGLAAAVALLILLGAPALVGMAQWWDILLVAIGLVLVLVELFLLPGIGIAGVLGVLCLLVGLIGTFVAGDVTSYAGQQELWTGLLTTLGAIFVAGVGIWFLSRQLHSFPVLNRLILHAELKEPGAGGAGVGALGGSASSAPVGLLEAMRGTQRALQPGDTGFAETDLRPSGRASINGRLLDVKSVGSFVHKGTPIRVVSVGRFVIEVEEAN